MRPSEIDFHATNKQHFFDLSNGEVLQGKVNLSQYVKVAAESSNIVNLGYLLRDGIPSEVETSYDQLDTSEWPDAKFRQFGRWLSKVVQPPNDTAKNHLNGSVLENSQALGMGPSRRAIRGVFGSISLFYKDIGESDAHHIGLFKDWALEDFVKHIKNVGGPKRPTTSDLRDVSDYSPKHPKPDYMRNRFKEIGGLRALFELAGYPVIDLWEKEDYIDWGVKFMEANDGIVPSSRMADYLSTKKKGPSGSSIRNHFDYIRFYQDEVMSTYQKSQLEKAKLETQNLDLLVFDLRHGNVPIDIFKLEGEDATVDIQYAEQLKAENLVTSKPTIARSDAEIIVSDICAQIGNHETIRRYAMLKVLSESVPYAPLSTQVKIIIRTNQERDRTFITQITRRYDTSPGEIENAALTLGFFDDIWPMRQHLEDLKLDDGYLDYYKRIEKVNKVRSGKIISI